jgi:UDP-glucose 4-epimerase
MRILITGASGNVGTALLRRLADLPHEVIGVSRREPPAKDAYATAVWVPLDLAAPDAADALLPHLDGVDAVVHLAWQIQPARDRDALIRTNQGGSRTVISAVRRAGVPHLVHMSSVGAYGAAPKGTWADESWPTTGVASSSYSVDKAACERMLDELEASAGAPLVTRVRPSLIMQPDAASEIARYFLGPLVPTSLLHPMLLRLTPWPSELRVQFVHTDDVADAFVRVLEQRAGGAFNLASSPVIDRNVIRRVFGGVAPPLPISVVRVAADLSFRAHLQPTDAGWIDLAASVPQLDSARARTDLGWRPAHPADETLLTFVKALRRRQGSSGPLLYPRRLLGHEETADT